MSVNKDRAKRLLVHYFRVVWPEDKPFDSDNQSEIEEIVDAIFDEMEIMEYRALMRGNE